MTRKTGGLRLQEGFAWSSSLHQWTGIKEVANVCNQSLMKLVTPEDDEPDEPKPVAQRQTEPNPEDSLPKQEGTDSGECPDVRIFTFAAGETSPGTKLVVSLLTASSTCLVKKVLC